VGTEPVSVSLVSSEHFLAEFLVSTVLDSVHFESVRVSVDVMVLGEQVRNGVENEGESADHTENNLGVGDLVSSEESDVFGNIVSHLGSGRRSSVIVLDHTVMELRGHGNNHVIEVGVEVTTLRYINSEGSGIMVTCQEVVRVVVETGVHGCGLGKFWGPHTHVGTFGLMDGLIWGPDSVMDDSLSVIPFLEVITSVLLMSGVDSWKVLHEGVHFLLLETLVHQEIVFLMHSSVASLARSGENLESSSQTILKIKS
jgi:hypothetical protein